MRVCLIFTIDLAKQVSHGVPKRRKALEQKKKKNEYYPCDLRRDSWLSVLVLEDLLVAMGMVSRAQAGSPQLLVRGLRYPNDN